MRIEWRAQNSHIALGSDKKLRETVSSENRKRVDHVIILHSNTEILQDCFTDLPNLKCVTIDCHTIEDISILLKYPLLTLRLLNYIPDISIVSQMVTLENLHISGCVLPDVSMLTSLKTLSVNKGTTTLLRSLLPSITTLRFKKMKDVKAEELGINRNICRLTTGVIPSLELLRCFPMLVELNISVTRHVDLTSIGTLQYLERLAIDYTERSVKTTILLPILPILTFLTVRNVILNDLTFLRACPSLKCLSMTNVVFPDNLTPIWELKLKGLCLEMCHNVKGLTGIITLKDTLFFLSLRHVPEVKDILFLSEMNAIRMLLIESIDITDISPISCLPLEYIRIYTRITKGIHHLFSIEKIETQEFVIIDVYRSCGEIYTKMIDFDGCGTIISGKELQEKLKGIDYVDESVGEFIKSS